MSIVREVVFTLCLTAAFFSSAVSKPLNVSQRAIVGASDAAKNLGCENYESWFPADISKKTVFIAKESQLNSQQLIKSSKLFCNVSTSADPLEPSTISLVEKGDLGGVAVEINHSTGSATIGEGKIFDNKGWEVACKRDEFTDKKSCYIRQYGLALIKNNGGYALYVGNDLTPGQKVELRLDKNKAINSLDRNGLIDKKDSDNFLREVKPTSRVIVRYTIFPNQHPEVRTIDTNTLGAAIKVMTMIDKSF